MAPGTLCLSSRPHCTGCTGLGLRPQGRRALYRSHDGAQRRRVTATSVGCASVSRRMSMNSQSSGGSLDASLWCMFLTKPGTCTRHRDAFRAARAAACPAFPEKCFPPQHIGLGLKGLRHHATPGDTQPWPLAAYLTGTGDNSLPKLIQAGSRRYALRACGARLCCTLGEYGHHLATPSEVCKLLQKKEQ